MNRRNVLDGVLIVGTMLVLFVSTGGSWITAIIGGLMGAFFVVANSIL